MNTKPAQATHLESASRGGRYYHLEKVWTPTGRFTDRHFRRYELIKVVDSERVLGTES